MPSLAALSASLAALALTASASLRAPPLPPAPPAAARAGAAARAAAAARRAEEGGGGGGGGCALPLLRPGLTVGAQYSRPAGAAAAARADALYGALVARGGALTQLSLPWADIEGPTGGPNFVLVAEILAGVRAKGLVPLFQIAAIDTEHASVPADLADPADPTRLRAGLHWNSTELIDRYAALLEVVAPLAVFSGAPYIGVGNEVSVNLLLHPETGYEFAEFAFTMRAFVQQLTSRAVGVGVTLTVGDVGGWAPPAAPPAWGAALLALSDATPLTYYPLRADATVETSAAAIARAVGDALAALPAGACAIFQEIGMPSGYNNASSVDGSSDAKQAAFFGVIRHVLDEANATRPLRAVSLYQLVDMADSDCEAFAKYYNASEPAFIEYLCTLGVVKADGTQKAGFDAFIDAFLPV